MVASLGSIFEHLISEVRELDFGLMKQFVRYSWYDLGGSGKFNIALTKKDKVFYGIEKII